MEDRNCLLKIKLIFVTLASTWGDSSPPPGLLPLATFLLLLCEFFELGLFSELTCRACSHLHQRAQKGLTLAIQVCLLLSYFRL